MNELIPHEHPALTALKTTGDFIKFTVTLGTGSIVLSVGLLNGTTRLPLLSKAYLAVSWGCLAISVILGVIAFSRIPVQIQEGEHDIHDAWLTIPAMIHEIAFMLGIIFLGLALLITMFFGSPADPCAC